MDTKEEIMKRVTEYFKSQKSAKDLEDEAGVKDV